MGPAQGSEGIGLRAACTEHLDKGGDPTGNPFADTNPERSNGDYNSILGSALSIAGATVKDVFPSVTIGAATGEAARVEPRGSSAPSQSDNRELSKAITEAVLP